MTEEIAATPGWVDERLDEVFSALPATPEVAAARRAYSACLGGRKAPGAPSDNLGAEFNVCRRTLHQALLAADVPGSDVAALEAALESLEAEIAADA